MATSIVVPVMTLGNCVFLPQQLLPLRIFEPRYRLMLEEALGGNRMFAVSQLDEDRLSPDDDEPPCPFTCVGRIAGHVGLPDGTSHLVLEGLRRAKVIKVERRAPYPRLEIAPLAEEDIPDPGRCTREIARILAYSERLIAELGEDAQPLIERLRGLANQPGPLADATAGHLVTDIAVRRRLLECLSPMHRLTLVADQLARLEAERQLGEQGKDLDLGMN